MRGCFANRHFVFFWRVPGKRACDVFRERQHDVWKEDKYNQKDSEQSSGIGSPCLSLLDFADSGLH